MQCHFKGIGPPVRAKPGLRQLARELADYDHDIEELKEGRNEIMERIKAICNHPDTEKKSHSIPGSYLDRSQYHEQIVCSICGKVLDEKVSYGSFG